MKLFIFVLLALASIATAQTDINGIISSNGNLTYVTNLFAITGPIYGDNTTAFVALDSAFDQLPASVLNATTSVPNLARKILRYSAFNSALNFTSLNETNANLTIYNNTIFNTLKSLDNSSGPVYFTYRNGSTFFNNYILFKRANGTQGSNGVVYTVNKLPLADFTLDDFVDLFNHSIFEEALDEAGLEDFAERRSRTIFSPSNAAFIAVTDFNATLPTSRPGDDDDDDLPYLRATLAKTPFTLRELLRYHISTRVYSFLNLTNDQLLPTNLTNKFIRVNIYNNDIFTVNGKVISNGGWIRDDDDNERDDEFDGPFEDSLERFNRRVGFFYVLNDVLFPPTQSAYQYIGNATNFSGNISEYTRDLLAQEAITVFWINSTTTSETDNLFILNGTYFAAGLLSGSYQTLNNSLNQSSILTVSNNGSAITFSTSSGLNFIVDSSILVTNGVIHVISTFVPEVSSSETGVISSVSGGISSAVDSASGGISSAIDSASGGITSAVSSASGGISSAIDSASGGITSAVSSASGGISSAVDSASGGISSAVDSASAGISSVIGSASDIIESIFGKRVPAATSA